MDTTIDAIRYPIGKFSIPQSFNDSDIPLWLHKIEVLPATLRTEVSGLTESQLDTPYREGGWTIRQVVHHLVDSHLNSYMRFKLAMTEENPTIRPYFEDRWAELPDAKNGDVEISLHLLEALHRRWALFLKSFKQNDWKRTFYHPESKKTFELGGILAMYAWHGEHHLSHIVNLKNKMNWK